MIAINKAYIKDVLCFKDKKIKYIEDRINKLSMQLKQSENRTLEYKASDILRAAQLKDIVPGKVSAKYYETGFVFVERQLDIEHQHQEGIKQQISKLLDEKESIYRIWTIYNSLDYTTHQLFELIYIKQYKWEAAKEILRISNNKISRIINTGLDDILKIYNSTYTDAQIACFKPPEPQDKGLKENVQISLNLASTTQN